MKLYVVPHRIQVRPEAPRASLASVGRMPCRSDPQVGRLDVGQNLADERGVNQFLVLHRFLVAPSRGQLSQRAIGYDG